MVRILRFGDRADRDRPLFSTALPCPNGATGTGAGFRASGSSGPFDSAAGVAGGLSGMLYLPGETAGAGVDTLRANTLLTKGIEILLDTRRESANPCCWSEGELGIAAVCLQAGLRIG